MDPPSELPAWTRDTRREPRLPRSPADAVAHVRRERRVDDLDRLKAGIGDAVEEPLTGAEQDGDEVEDEPVDHACRKRLAHGRRAAGDVDSAITGGLRGARERGVEAVPDEIERRPAPEFDRLVLVVREDEDRSVVRRLVAPPAAPVALPRPANRSEHVASHQVRAAWAEQQVACAGVGVVQRLVEMPAMQLDTATAEGVLEALVGSCDKTVERNGHVTGRFAHAASTAPVRKLPVYVTF